MTFEDIEINIIKLLNTIGFTLFRAPATNYPEKDVLYFKGRKKDDWCIKIEFGHTKDIIKEKFKENPVK